MMNRPAFVLSAVLLLVVSSPTQAQELSYEDRIGSEIDRVEEARFKRLTMLLEAKKITQQQAYNIWQRITSDKKAVGEVLQKAVAAGELTGSQVERLMPLLDMKQEYVENQHGTFGKNKSLKEGQFKKGEVSDRNREAVYKRLVAANHRGVIHDFDVSSIMAALYSGWDWQEHTPEEEYAYSLTIKPRWRVGEEEGWMPSERILASLRKKRGGARAGYGASKLDIKDPAELAKGRKEPIFSGPQAGEKLPPFTVVGVRGEREGKEFDPIAIAGDDLHLLVFGKMVTTFGRFLGQLAQQLNAIESASKRSWSMSFIVVNDDPAVALKKKEWVDRATPSDVLIGLSRDGVDGPPSYGLDRNLTATVIVARGGKVVHSLAFPQDVFYTEPHILGAVAGAMGVDHDTLRKYIGATPGDQAQALGRGRGGRGGAAYTEDQKIFRAQLAEWVRNGEITREEAGELFREMFPQDDGRARQGDRAARGGENAREEVARDRARVRQRSGTAQDEEKSEVDWEEKYRQFLVDNPKVKAAIDSGRIDKAAVLEGIKSRHEENEKKVDPEVALEKQYRELLEENPRLKAALVEGRITKEQLLSRIREGNRGRRKGAGREARGEGNAERDRGARRGREARKRTDYGYSGNNQIKDPAEHTKAQEKPIFSGPQKGEKLASFQATGLRGELEGKDFDPAARAGNKPHLLLFTRGATGGRIVPLLGYQLGTIMKASKRDWHMSVIHLSDDPAEVTKLMGLLKGRIADFVELGISKDGADGPGSYGVDRSVTHTFIFAKDGKVVHNLVFTQQVFFNEPHLLGAIADVMGVDHATLGKWLDDPARKTAGSRGRGGQGGRGGLSKEAVFRADLAERLRNGEITREEAGRLYREKFPDRERAEGRPREKAERGKKEQ